MALNSFIGIDMAWRIDGNHSGVAVMAGGAQSVSLEAVSLGITSMDGVVEFVGQHSQDDTVIAIDASLVVKNAAGQRPCETLIGREFGKYHASCHTSKTTRPYHNTGMKLVERLEGLGFEHQFDIDTARERPGKWVFEVYPHPAMVRLFGLDRIVPYKKGSVAEKRMGLEILRTHLSALANGSRGLVRSGVLDHLLGQPLAELKGTGLKRYEDSLDAVFCAYLAWYCWRWGAERNEMFGTMAQGYIVVAKAESSGSTPQSAGQLPL